MKLTWFGHSAFRIEIEGATILIDPCLSGNPSFPGDVAGATKGVTHILLTHGHGDHVGDTLSIAKASGAVVVANADLATWLARRGATRVEPMNTGGTVDLGPFRVSFTNALHSSAMIDENRVSHSLGNPNGLVIRAPSERTLYHAGDTDIFSDMALIDELYKPRIGILPVGDRFTMGGAVAALAARRYFHFETVIPCHYGTFPIIDGTADAFVEGMRGSGAEVVTPALGVAVTL